MQGCYSNPQKFCFGENPGKFCGNFGKACENLCKIPVCGLNLQTWHPKSKWRQFEESLQSFLDELLVLSKTCNFRDVTAEVYRNELVRDAFINGLKSHEIRQRRLENNGVTLDQVSDRAYSQLIWYGFGALSCLSFSWKRYVCCCCSCSWRWYIR